MLCKSLSRGDDFRLVFAELGTLRSILPSRINILALTATASKPTLDAVVHRLAMVDPVIIGIPPNRPNIFLSVKPCLQLKEFSQQIVGELYTMRNLAPKSIVFCQSFIDCYQLYDSVRKGLKEDFTYPSGYPDLYPFRLLDMYHGGCMTYVRENILNAFTKVDSVLRIVIATSSFGMGIDCPDIRRVIHWGTPQDIEEYVQETGRAGRDNKPSEAILYPKTHHSISDNMKLYITNQSDCRRKLLFSSFLFYETVSYSVICSCCDVCKCLCECIDCSKFK